MNYIVLNYGEIMFLNVNQYFYVYLYWGKCPLGHIRPPLQIITQHNFLFLFFFVLDVNCYKIVTQNIFL